MGWLLKRQLAQNATRLAGLRSELGQLNEQLEAFQSDADDSEIRALVSETSDAGRHARDARKHADVMKAHRQRVRDEITRLEQRQDELLDRLTARG